MERGREEQGLMEGGECGGGLMEGRECWGWGMSPCVRGEPPRPLASRCRRVSTPHRVLPPHRVSPALRVLPPRRVLPALRVSLPRRLSPHVSPLFACHLFSRVVVIARCQRVVLGVCSCSWCWTLVVVHGVARSPFPSGHATYMAWALVSFAIRCAPSSWGCKQG